MKVRSVDGQVFDAWVNLPENHRRVPKWLGQVDTTHESRTVVIAPDGSRLTVGLGDVVVNADGRLQGFSPRHAARLFDIIEGVEEFPSPQRVLVAAQPEGLGRARQGMVSSDRGRLQPDSGGASIGVAGTGNVPTAEAAGDSGASCAEQDGERSGEPSASGPAAAKVVGGSGDGGDAFGATGGPGEEDNFVGDENSGGSDESEAGTDGEAPVTSKRRRR